MNAPRLLNDVLAEARAELRRQAPDSAQDAALLSRLQRLLPAESAASVLQRNGGSAVLRRTAWGGVSLGGLALLLAVGLLVVEPPRRALPSPESGFMPVVSAAEWQRALSSFGSQDEAAVLLMPTELPRERLALLGLPYDATRADQPVRAELMLNPQGQLLAVRFLE